MVKKQEQKRKQQKKYVEKNSHQIATYSHQYERIMRLALFASNKKKRRRVGNKKS